MSDNQTTRKTKTVRIVKKVYEKALGFERENHYDECSWLSYLIIKGMEKLKDELK